MQESDDSNSKADDADTDAENVEVQPDAEDTEEAQKKKDAKATEGKEEEKILVGDSEEVQVADDTVSLLEPVTTEESGTGSAGVTEVTEVTAVSELKEEAKDEEDVKDEAASEEPAPSKPEEKSTSSADETELSLTDDIGDSDEVPKEGGSFLELDTETRVKMDEIEESERLAEEAERAAEEEAELFETGIFAVKTSIGHEKMVANWLAIRARKRKMDALRHRRRFHGPAPLRIHRHGEQDRLHLPLRGILRLHLPGVAGIPAHQHRGDAPSSRGGGARPGEALRLFQFSRRDGLRRTGAGHQ